MADPGERGRGVDRAEWQQAGVTSVVSNCVFIGSCIRYSGKPLRVVYLHLQSELTEIEHDR